MVMGIVNLALMILAMVLFGGAATPFSDQLGGEALHIVWAGAVVFYL